MANWDVFHADSLELERDLTTDAIRAAMAGGSLREDDLVRPAGTTTAWSRLGDLPELSAPAGMSTVAPPERPGPPQAKPADAPGRIRLDRAPAPYPEPGDFEVEADRTGAGPTPEPRPSTSTATPAWRELGREPDDVSFPVIPEGSGMRGDRATRSAPAPPETGPEAEPIVAPAWEWPDDNEDDEEEWRREDVGDEGLEILEEDDGLEVLDEGALVVPDPHARSSTHAKGNSRVALPVVPSRDWNEDRHPVDDVEEAEDFTLSRGGPMTVEELDLAPMVDVAFQLVLFFMVTATTVLYRTLEIPKPTSDQAPSAVAQGQSRTLNDLQKEYVLVEIDAGGGIQIDHEPVAADVDAMAERLRTAREKTGRKFMLLSADYATPHRNAVLAYDAAIEIGMEIAIARPNAPQGPAPSVFPGAPKGDRARPAPPPPTPTAALDHRPF